MYGLYKTFKMKYWFLLLSIIFVFSSCLDEQQVNEKENTSEKTTKKQHKGGREIIDAGSQAQYTGKPRQLMIVSENTVYVDEIAHFFDSVFQQGIRPYYPLTEYFKVYHRTFEEFKRLSTQLRNVIELEIDERIESGKPKMYIYENYYARTQLYTKLKANNMNDLHQLLEQEIDYLFKLYDKQEWKREFIRHNRNKNVETRELLQAKFGIDLTLPSRFKYESIDNTYGIIILPEKTRQMELKFGSGSTARANFIQSGLMIWQYPYTDTSQFTPERLMMMRDTILKRYAKHEMEGVYMGTQDHPAVLPIHEKLRVGDVTGYQFRGMYKFTGKAEPSGGRFWSYHFRHPYRKTIVALSGYIDAPPTISPALEINQIRAMIYSLKVVE